MNILILCNKRDMTYEVFLKNNMSAVEWKFNEKINRNKSLINKFPGNWMHPLNKKSESYRV